MPKHVIISKLGDPEVLKYQEYDLPNEIKDNEVRIKQSSIGLNYIPIIYCLFTIISVMPNIFIFLKISI